ATSVVKRAKGRINAKIQVTWECLVLTFARSILRSHTSVQNGQRTVVLPALERALVSNDESQ
ncbi:hypothetical protein CHS0354_030668, partial [Potamilus streckersoni]